MVLGRSQGLCGRSWAALRASVGGPGPLSGPLWAILGRLGIFVDGPGLSWVCSWVLCWRSGAYVRGLGPQVGGLGPLLGPMLAVLAALGASVGGPGPSWAEKIEVHEYLENVLIS